MIRKREIKVQQLGEDRVQVSGECVFTGESYSVVVPSEGFARWQAGEPIQRAMPEVPSEEREFLISGISPSGWAKTFGQG